MLAAFISFSEQSRAMAAPGPSEGASDLCFHLAEAGVQESVQSQICGLGYDSLRLLAGLEETRERVRDALIAELGLNPAQGTTRRTWESWKSRNWSRRSPTRRGWCKLSELFAMSAAVEALLRDTEVPSKQVIAMRLEQVEENLKCG